MVNENGVQLPIFLDDKYLENVLQKYEKDKSVKILNVQAEPAVAAGNNYASLIVRAYVKYIKNGTTIGKSLIIKTVLSDPEMAQLVKDTGIYDKEAIMYHRILPKYHKLLESVGDTEKLFSPAISVDIDHSTIIFEDLKPKGFCLGNRLKGLDQKHVDLVIKKIAKFHACSMVLKERNEEDFSEFKEGMIRDDATTRTYFTTMMKTFTEEIKSLDDLDKYSAKLSIIADLIVEQGKEMFEESKFPIKVLIHGDLWVNNMMFKYDENSNPEDLVLVIIS